MGLDVPIDIAAEQRKTVLALLARYLPNTTAWVYGSRVTWTSSPKSDLDMVVFSRPEQAGRVSDLREAFEESNLPFRVDLFVWDEVHEQFRKQIEAEHVALVEREERRAGGEWSFMSFRDAGISLIDCEHRTPPASEYGYPYVAIPQVRDGRINLSGVRRISRKHFDEWTRKAAPESFDIVLSRRCNPGETGFVSEGLKFALGQNLVLLRSDGTKVFKPFLRWLVRGPQWWDQVGKYINVGAVFDSLRCADIPGFRVPVPPLSEQRAVAHILGTLDDKIELNRRMNQTLAEMARALFKSWFVDFDPVRAKATLKQRGVNPSQGGSDWSVERARAYLDSMDPDIVARFPDSLVDSELGPIPVGWEFGGLEDVIELLSGGTPKTSVTQYWDGNIPWYTAKDAPSLSDVFVLETERSITHAGVDNSAARILPAHTTIITARGTVGRLACLGRPMAMNQTCYGIRGACGYPAFFTYWKVRMTVDELRRRTHGTIFDTITRQTFKLVDSAIPPVELAGEFEKTIQPVMSGILRNLHESRTLTALRDTLLPKLMSGEVYVGETNKLPQRAGA